MGRLEAFLFGVGYGALFGWAFTIVLYQAKGKREEKRKERNTRCLKKSHK